MHKLVVALVASFFLALPHAVQAQQAGVEPFLKPAAPSKSEGGFSFGLRLAYGIPLGDADASAPLGDVYKGEIPIWIDAGYHFRNWFVGLYFQLGIAVVNKDKALGAGVCTASGVSCSGSDVRLGIEGMYSFSPGQSFNPWVGLGLGYEWAHLHGEGPGGSADLDLKGWEFLNVQLGGDFMVSSIFALGPYVAFSLAQYGTLTVTSGGASLSGDITDKKIHGWLQFGVKGTFNL